MQKRLDRMTIILVVVAIIDETLIENASGRYLTC